MTAPLRCATAAAAVLLAFPARAHHGVAAVGVAGPEGPGAALETTSPLPLPQGMLFAMARSEFVPFRSFAFAEPENKSYASFSTLALGYGVRPWLSVYAFQPVNVKAQDGVGANAGAGDTNLMVSLGLKWDEALRLVPEKESLDDLLDWHFGAWASTTVPVGPTGHRDRAGAYFEPEMQTGFGSPSPAVGLSALKQVTGAVTWVADASYQHFFPHTYAFGRHRFGGETRLNTAVVWRALGAGRFRLDLDGELNGLHIQRDREGDEAGALRALPASGGAVLYAAVGARASWGPLSVSLGVKRAALKRLNEQADQQGSEGLEVLRAAFGVSYTTRL